ncbi:MAG TPA: amino acid permease [Nitrospirota bacterium]|nr:amino acid permease [Nitrospirota bacterium]
MELRRQLGLFTGIFVIVADMIGTGIFMTTGNVLGMTKSALLVLVLWGIGGLVATAGALCYAELATIWPEAGGEYVYLKNIFGPLPAFLTGWISLVVGFSAPVAVSSQLLVQYVNRFLHGISGASPSATLLDPPGIQKLFAACLIAFFGSLHMIGVKKGSSLQNLLTAIKILLVVSLICFGLSRVDWSMTGRLVARYESPSVAPHLDIPQTGLALLIIMYAYSGWNCTSYLAGEIQQPGKNLPRALLLGTLLTTILYALLNILFLISTEGAEIMGKDEVGAIAVSHLFGPGVGGIVTLGIAVILLSSVSAQMMVGPRVSYAMAKDKMIFRSLARVHRRFETPHVAILAQMVLAIFYVLSGSALVLVIYLGFALSLFPLLAVAGLLYIRHARPEVKGSFRVPCGPLVSLVYIVFTIAMMLAALVTWTKTSCCAIVVVLMGIPVFLVWERIARKGHRSGEEVSS